MTSTYTSRFAIYGVVDWQTAVRSWWRCRYSYRRNNSFILLSNGCFADIDCCVSVKTCTCTTCKCNCNRNVVLIVTCYSSLRAQREFDHYVGIDLMQFVRKVRQSDQQLLAISPSDVVDKCVTINISNNRYAMQLPKFEIMWLFFFLLLVCEWFQISVLYWLLYLLSGEFWNNFCVYSILQ